MKRKASIALSLLLAAGTALTPSVPVVAAPHINPYGRVEAELQFSREVKEEITEENGTTAVSLGSGNYFSASTINFSKGVSQIGIRLKADGPGIIVIHKGDTDGDDVGNIKYKATDGYEDFTVSVKDLGDADQLTFVNKVGSCYVDSWIAEPGETAEEPVDQPDTPDVPDVPDTPDQPEVPDTPDQPEVPDQPQQPVSSGLLNPYEKVEVENTSRGLTGAMVTPSKNAIMITDGGYILVQDIDFSEGLSGFKVQASGTGDSAKLNVYLDSDPSPIGSVTVGNDISKETSIEVSTSATGKHYLYFEAKGGAVTIDAWKAVKASETVEQPPVEEQPVEEPPVGDTVNPYTKVEAEAASEITQGKVTPSKNAVAMMDGGYVITKNVDFSNGLSGFAVYAQASAPKVKLNVYMDGAKSPIGSINLGTDMTKASMLKLSSDLTGKHDVYFQAEGGNVTFDAWNAMKGQGTVTPPVVEPPVGDTVDPYTTVEAEASAEVKNAMVTPNKQSVVINADGYMVAKNVNFAQGISGIFVSAKAAQPKTTIAVYIDKVAGDPIGTITIGSMGEFKEAGARLTTDLTGTHDVYFVAKGGAATVDTWHAMKGQGTVTPPVVEPPVGDTVNPYTAVEAEIASELSGAMITPKKDAVNLLSQNGYAVIKNVNFAKGVSEFKVNASAKGASVLEIKLDGADKETVASARLDQTNDAKSYTLKALKEVTGTHDVYFVLKSGTGAAIDSWSATEASGTVTPPVEEPPVGDTVNPYEKVEAEDSAVKSGAMVAPNKQTVVINKDGYVVAKNVDLSKGLKDITVKAGATAASRLEVRLDKVDGERIAMFMVGNEAKELKFNTSATVTGTHDLYFVDTMDGSITFDYWVASPADGTVVTPPVSGGTNPYEKIEAETTPSTNFTDAMLAPGSKSVVINPNGYIRIDNLDFSKGVSAFKAYAKSSKPMTKLNVYIDETLVGTVDVGTDMAKETVINVSSSATGKHYIYFEAKNGAVTLDAWQAVDASGTVVTPPASESINPYNKIEAESTPKENYTSAMLAPSKQAVVINNNGYILIQNIDFSKGLSGFAINAQASAPKVKLNVYIDDSNTPIGTMDVGVDMTKTTYMKLPSGTNVTGNHYIYIEAKGGNVTLDAWQAMAAGSAPIDQPPVVEPPVYEDINPYNKVEAETIPSASYTNAMLTPSKQAVSIMKGGNVVAKNVVFSNGVSEFKVTAGSTASAKLEVRLGSATGTLLGSANISGDAKEYTIKSSQNLSGKKDIYFVSPNGVISFDSWKVTEYKEPVVTPPPVVETGVKASYKENSWNDGYQLNFTVTNSSGKTVNSWKVKVKKSDINVSQSWCVNVSQEGDYYVFTPMSYNSTLANGQSTEFGMIGRGQVGSSISYTVE